MQKTILLVDDDPLYVDLLSEILGADLHHILTARDGERALTYLISNKIDLIVSDIEMPNMNGMEFHKTVCLNEEWKKIPFIFLTATENPNAFLYMQNHPTLFLIRKASGIVQLLTTIKHMLRA